MEDRHTFSKEERLCSKREIERLFEQGETIYRHPLKSIYTPNQIGFSRLIVSVPKKLFKRAVRRNYIKRIIREAYRLNKGDSINVMGFDIAIIYTAKSTPTFEEINKKLNEILEKIYKPAKESSIPSSDSAD